MWVLCKISRSLNVDALKYMTMEMLKLNMHANDEYDEIIVMTKYIHEPWPAELSVSVQRSIMTPALF